MYYLLAFLAGCIACYILQPIIDAILQWFLMWVEYKKGKISVKIQKLNKEITEISMPEGGCTHSIGFAVDDTDEYDDYEGEEDKK